MANAEERWAIRMMIAEANALYRESRFPDALRAAECALEEAEKLADRELEIKALTVCADAQHNVGQEAAALNAYTRILALTNDPSRRAELERADVAWNVADAYCSWADTASYMPAFPIAKLFQALDEGEAYVRSIGRPAWRAGFLHLRASLLQDLGRLEEAIGYAEEGLALKQSGDAGPGPTLASHRWRLSDLLYSAKRFDAAATQYRAVLTDTTSSVYSRQAAVQGLARCALAAGEVPAARQHAEEAAHLAEGMGDAALTQALAVLTDACLAVGDLPAAHAAAERRLLAARRLDSPHHLYFALRGAADVALREGDAARARALLEEATPMAEALDRQRGDSTSFREEMERRQQRLAELEAGAAG